MIGRFNEESGTTGLVALRGPDQDLPILEEDPDLSAGGSGFRGAGAVNYCAGNGNRLLSRRQSVA